jgi:hypothetical protein
MPQSCCECRHPPPRLVCIIASRFDVVETIWREPATPGA